MMMLLERLSVYSSHMMAMHVGRDVSGTQLIAAMARHTNFRTKACVGSVVLRVASMCLLLVLQGCSTGWVRLNHSAQQAGVARYVITTADFTHTVFVKADSATTDAIPVFIEGDGMPWRNLGWQPNPDPRPEHALAFNLFLKTTGAAWYITRPCYDDSLATSACNVNVWTDARYSAANVTSMATALRRFAAQQQVQKLVLLGYSGGGELAVLLAAQMPEVVGVVTLAANLDQAAWTQAHHYSPLVGSLNAATDTLDLSMPHAALHGRRDDNVPLSTLSGFIATHPSTRWRYFDEYDHVCCWERDWPMLWPEVLQMLKTQ
jgi:hypothetical protein